MRGDEPAIPRQLLKPVSSEGEQLSDPGRGLDVNPPPVHHLSALLQVFRPVVGCADLVALGMSELPLDDIRPEAGLVQDRARQCPETVDSGGLVLAKTVEGVNEGIFRDRLSLVSLRWKE
jgi:hypothetical protein